MTLSVSVALVAAVAGKDDHDEEEKALIHRSQTEKMTPLCTAGASRRPF